MARRKAQIAYINYLDRGERLLATGEELRSEIQRIVDDVAGEASRNAPRDTGRGAASIRGEVRRVPAGWEGRVSWTRPHYYMYMHEKGWKHKPARPFLRPAADRVRDR